MRTWLPASLLAFAAALAPDVVMSQPASKKLVILGASYAQDWGTPALPGYRVTNRGQTGEESTQLLARFDRDVLAAKPDTVLIWGHINDIFRAPNGNHAAAVERAQSNYRVMLDKARANGITVILATEVTLSKPGGVREWLATQLQKLRGKEGYQERINRNVRTVNAFLRETAQRERLQLLDFERAFDDGAGFRRDEFTREDGSHISPAGYTALTRYTTAQLAPATAARTP